MNLDRSNIISGVKQALVENEHQDNTNYNDIAERVWEILKEKYDIPEYVIAFDAYSKDSCSYIICEKKNGVVEYKSRVSNAKNNFEEQVKKFQKHYKNFEIVEMKYQYLGIDGAIIDKSIIQYDDKDIEDGDVFVNNNGYELIYCRDFDGFVLNLDCEQYNYEVEGKIYSGDECTFLPQLQIFTYFKNKSKNEKSLRSN